MADGHLAIERMGEPVELVDRVAYPVPLQDGKHAFP